MARRAVTTTLKYIGPEPAAVGIVPLPEGWPAADHDEPNTDRYAAKLASGNYAAVYAPEKE